MIESDEIVEQTEFKSTNLEQKLLPVQDNGNEVEFKFNHEIEESIKLSCSSPFNGSMKPPEISMNDISVIANTNELCITSPDNRESFQSVYSESDSSMYRTAYDQTEIVNAMNGSNSMDEHVVPNGTNLLISTADIHNLVESPSPTFGTNDSTLMEQIETTIPESETQETPDVCEYQATPSPILSPSPQGHELNVTSIEGEKEADAVFSNGLQERQLQQQQLESGFRSESDSLGSPSCEARADSFEFNTCSPFTQQHESSQQHQLAEEKIAVEEILPEELKQAENTVVEVIGVVAPQSEQSPKQEEIPFEDEDQHYQKQQLQDMFPPLESTTPYKSEGFEIEEDVEEPKLFAENEIVSVISTVQTDQNKSETVSEQPSNPFLDFNQAVETDQLVPPASPLNQEEDKISEQTFEDTQRQQPEIIPSHPDNLSTPPIMNFNQVIQESMAISSPSPVLSDTQDGEANRLSNGNGSEPFGYSSSFNETTVIEKGPSFKDNDDGDDHINESSNHASSSKYQDDSEDSDSSQDSVKENTFSVNEKPSHAINVDVTTISSENDDGPSVAVTSPVQEISEINEPSMLEPSVVPVLDAGAVQFEESMSPFLSEDQSTELSKSDDMNGGQSVEEANSHLEPRCGDEGMSEVLIQNEKEEENQNEPFTNHELCGTESEIGVTNCVEGVNVNGSPLFVEDNHDLKQTKEGSIIFSETTTSDQQHEEQQQQPQNVEVTKGDEYEKSNDMQSNLASELKRKIELDDESSVNSAANISKIEMPSPMRDGLIDMSDANNSQDDMNQWGAPSLLLGGHQQDLLSSSAMSEASLLETANSVEVNEAVATKTAVAVQEMKPELMIDIMNEYKNFSPNTTSTPTETASQPLSPQQPSQTTDSVPDLIVESKSVDLKKAIAGKAKLSRGEPKAPTPDVQKTSSKPAPPTSKPAVRTTRPTVSSAPKPTVAKSSVTRAPIVGSSRPTATTAPVKKPATAPPKPVVSRTTASAAAKPPVKATSATTRPPVTKTAAAPRVIASARPATNGLKTTTRPAVTSAPTRPATSTSLSRQANSISTLKPSVVTKKPVAMSKATSSTSSLRTAASKATGSTTASSTASKPSKSLPPRVASTTTRTTASTKGGDAPKPVNLAPRAVKKPVASSINTGLNTNGSSSNGTH